MPAISLADVAAAAAPLSFFDISTSQASALGALVGGIVLAFLGYRHGEEARKNNPPETSFAMIGAAIVDHDTLRDLTSAVSRLCDTIHLAVERVERREAIDMTHTLDRLARKIDSVIDPKGR